MRIEDRLQQAKSRPAVVEDAVRTALRDSIAWRVGGGSSPLAEAFVAAAIVSARLTLDITRCDAAERSRTLSAVHRVATRFARTALCRRLMQVSASKFVRLPSTAQGCEAIVRGRDRRLHAIALTARADALQAAALATRAAAATPLPLADRLTPLTVHVFSLATGHHRTFERDVLDTSGHRVAAARVA